MPLPATDVLASPFDFSAPTTHPPLVIRSDFEQAQSPLKQPIDQPIQPHAAQPAQQATYLWRILPRALQRVVID